MKKGKKALKLTAIFLFALVLVSGLGQTVAYADTPYKTYTVDGEGLIQETQTAYLAYETITKFGDAFLSGFIYGIQKNLGIIEALKHSVSFSQAVVSSYAGEVLDLSQFKKYIDSVKVESIYTKGGV